MFPDDGQRHELIDGEHYVTPAPNVSHQAVLGNLHFLMRRYLEAHPAGRVFFAPFDVIFSKFDVVEPDLLYLSKAREASLQEHGLTGSPDLVVEVASKSTKKRDQTAGQRFDKVLELSLDRGDILTTPLLPGLQLRLADIFSQA